MEGEDIDVHRYASFRGRKCWARCYWKWKGEENVIHFYFNMWWKFFKERNWQNWEAVFPIILSMMDFHEWLHLFIHRESGVKGTFIVTDGCEIFIERSHEALRDILLEDCQ